MQKMMSSLRWVLLWLIFAMGSMDIFGVFHVKGFTVRWVLFLMAAFVLLEGTRLFREKKWHFSWWWGWLVAIAFFHTLFSFMSPAIFRGLGYAVWLWLFVLWVVVLSHISREEGIFAKLVVVYVTSFLPAMIVGWLQWVIPSLAWSDSFLWKSQGALGITAYHALHRVNGWNYEPSYFATYLLPIFPLLVSLIVHQRGKERIFTAVFFLFAALMLFLTTSRMGWLAGSIFLVGSLGIWGARKLFQTKNKRLLPYLWIGVGMAVVMVVLLGVGFSSFRNLFVKVLKWSFVERLEGMQHTLKVFFTHPWRGVGLGGVAGAIAQLQQGIVPQGGEVKAFEGMNVLFEYMAAFGVWGMFLLGGFLGSVLVLLRRWWDKLSSWEKGIGIGLFAGLGLQVFLLLFNQNILRVYVWNHVAMVGAFLATMEAPGKEEIEEKESQLFSLPVWFSSFLLAVVVASLFVTGYVFQPIRVKVYGGDFQWRFAKGIEPIQAKIFYVVHEVIIKDIIPSGVPVVSNTTTFSFKDSYSLSKTFFTKEEISQVYSGWKDSFHLQEKYFRERVEEGDTYLREIDPHYLDSPENFYRAMNALLEKDEIFATWAQKYPLSDLTHFYLNKKRKTPGEKVRFHRLVLEDVFPFLPSNLEEHRIRYYLVELSCTFVDLPANQSEQTNMLFSSAITNIRWDTSLGVIETPVEIFPVRFLRKDERVFRVFWEFSPMYWKLQAIHYRNLFTVLVVGVFVLTWGLSYLWFKKLAKREQRWEKR
ncbi:O-antigen ligase family protein [Thermospira aquatica]|uniref:O-antigen ligase family protein n=1 Tax=Thermospira aquatica TaxID=2828656 RepID=A0AAX3BHF7_9SPIR|nr:O-antigen ligase family protein [Thermospira aquatica]URA10861.1 O-antigen ligase family protein [Thermospira aquatica]